VKLIDLAFPNRIVDVISVVEIFKGSSFNKEGGGGTEHFEPLYFCLKKLKKFPFRT
jgi:hypothetical protein